MVNHKNFIIIRYLALLHRACAKILFCYKNYIDLRLTQAYFNTFSYEVIHSVSPVHCLFSLHGHAEDWQAERPL